MHPPPRSAELVLVSPDGALVGVIPPVQVETPWWQDIAPVVRAVRDHHGVDITVLRRLGSELARPHGGLVTYLAEVTEPVAAAPWPGTLDGHPLRLPYARPGGPAADIAWATAQLTALGLAPTERPQQVRTWNLSSLWRLPVAGQTAWLKVVPPFFSHEGPLIERLGAGGGSGAGAGVPQLLAHGGGRMLLAEIPGDDLHEAGLPQLLDMVDLLQRLQEGWSERIAELLALGLSDDRGPGLTRAIRDLLTRTGGELPAEDRATLTGFAAELEQRFAELAACGLPDTLVHGDLHRGNFRGGPSAQLTLLDWGDSYIGHPLLDQAALLGSLPPETAYIVRQHWLDHWRVRVPGSDPARALELTAPIAAARQAVIYQRFLDQIEPSEQPYHQADPARWLQRAAEAVRRGDQA